MVVELLNEIIGQVPAGFESLAYIVASVIFIMTIRCVLGMFYVVLDFMNIKH